MVLFGSFRIFSDRFGSQEPAAAFCSPFLAQSFNKPLALLASPQAHPRKLGPSNVEFWELCRPRAKQLARVSTEVAGMSLGQHQNIPKPGIAPTRCEKLTGMVPMPCMDQWIPKNAWDAAGAGFVWKWGSKIPILMRELNNYVSNQWVECVYFQIKPAGENDCFNSCYSCSTKTA